ESPVLVFIVVVSLVVSNRLRLEYLRSHVWLYALTPLFVVPLMMQRYLMPDVSDLPPGQPAFSAPHFLEWTGAFLKAQLVFDWSLPYAILVNWIAAGMLLALAAWAALGRIGFASAGQRRFFTTVFACVVVNYL